MKSKPLFVFAIALSVLLSFSVTLSKESQIDRTILQGVSFKRNSAVLQESSREDLEALLRELKAKPSLKMIIEGYTDSTGSDQNNLVLSRSRAQAVADWLVAHGIESARLQVAGYGSSRPVADNRTSEGRALNRRIEIVKVDSEVPAAVLPTHSYQFEPVLDGFEVRHDFVIQNKGSAPLFISRVKTG
jgi:hypothetical protein